MQVTLHQELCQQLDLEVEQHLVQFFWQEIILGLLLAAAGAWLLGLAYFMGMMSQLIPLCFGTSGFVRTRNSPYSATGPKEHQILCPLTM
mgnify:CR=1 FL=1